MRRDRPERSGPGRSPTDADLSRCFDRSDVAAVYVFGSSARSESHALSDLDLAYLGSSGEAEDRAFDELYEALQKKVGEGRFDLVPLRRAPLHLQFAIATEGRLLLSRDPVLTERFAARAITRYLDFKHYRDEYFAAGA